MSKLNRDFVVYKNALEWMKLNKLKPEGEELDEKKLMYEMFDRKFHLIKSGGFIFAVVAAANPFSKKDSVERVLKAAGKYTRMIVASTKTAKQLIPVDNVRSITSDWLLTNPLEYISAAKYEIVPESELGAIRREMNLASFGALPRIRYESDPCAFWIDAKRGAVVKVEGYTEDVLSTFHYRIVV